MCYALYRNEWCPNPDGKFCVWPLSITIKVSVAICQLPTYQFSSFGNMSNGYFRIVLNYGPLSNCVPPPFLEFYAHKIVKLKTKQSITLFLCDIYLFLHTNKANCGSLLKIGHDPATIRDNVVYDFRVQ